MTEILEIPILVTTWNPGTKTFSVCRKFISGWKVSCPNKIRVKGKIATVTFGYDPSEDRYRFASTFAVHDPTQWWAETRDLKNYKLEITP
jgi:hypothetical protein